MIYRTEAINDQVITTLSTRRAGYFGSRMPRNASLMRCNIADPLRYFCDSEVPVLEAVMIVFFSTSNTAAVSWSPSPIAIASV